MASVALVAVLEQASTCTCRACQRAEHAPTSTQQVATDPVRPVCTTRPLRCRRRCCSIPLAACSLWPCVFGGVLGARLQAPHLPNLPCMSVLTWCRTLPICRTCPFSPGAAPFQSFQPAAHVRLQIFPTCRTCPFSPGAAPFKSAARVLILTQLAAPFQSAAHALAHLTPHELMGILNQARQAWEVAIHLQASRGTTETAQGGVCMPQGSRQWRKPLRRGDGVQATSSA